MPNIGLTIKIFLKNKFIEICEFLGEVFIGLILPLGGLVLLILGGAFGGTCLLEYASPFQVLLVVYILLFLCIVFIISIPAIAFKRWVQSNWERAKREAEKISNLTE